MDKAAVGSRSLWYTYTWKGDYRLTSQSDDTFGNMMTTHPAPSVISHISQFHAAVLHTQTAAVYSERAQ